MIIGIISRPVINESNKVLYGVYESINNAILKNGGICLGLVPNITHKEEEDVDLANYKKIIDICDGFLLQGDDHEYPYDDEFIKQIYITKKPVLGICLGMQLMGKFLGASITKIPNGSHQNKNIMHNVTIKENTKLFNILKTTKIKVNTRHNYMLTNIEGSSYADDLTIESIEDSNHPFFIGVQWHPENLVEHDIVHNRLFNEFIKKCRG